MGKLTSRWTRSGMEVGGRIEIRLSRCSVRVLPNRGPAGHASQRRYQKVLEKSLATRPRTPLSQCRGRGFESNHLRRRLTSCTSSFISAQYLSCGPRTSLGVYGALPYVPTSRRALPPAEHPLRPVGYPSFQPGQPSFRLREPLLTGGDRDPSRGTCPYRLGEELQRLSHRQWRGTTRHSLE